MNPERRTFCVNCGTPHQTGPTPRRCGSCGHVMWRDPDIFACSCPIIPLAGGGVLTVTRAIEPFIGGTALPGGFIDPRETPTQAAARETHEETGILLPQSGFRLFRDGLASNGNIILFLVWTGPEISLPDNFQPNREVAAIGRCSDPAELCFQTHADALRAFFDCRGNF